jgi:hypothetical protein
VKLDFNHLHQKIVNKSGYCDFDIVQDGKIEINHRVFVSNTVINETSFKQSCEENYSCNNPCTYDQEYISSKCQFINCKAKYNGIRNFTNNRTGFCESIQVCNSLYQTYDSLENKCIFQLIPITVSPKIS